MFTAAGCHGRPRLRIAFETLQVSAHGLNSSSWGASLLSEKSLQQELRPLLFFKTNDMTHTLSLLEFVSEAPLKTR